jgi:hypothetical protein
MAHMLPTDNQTFTTPGEEVFCRFLQGAARPDERNTAWPVRRQLFILHLHEEPLAA